MDGLYILPADITINEVFSYIDIDEYKRMSEIENPKIKENSSTSYLRKMNFII